MFNLLLQHLTPTFIASFIIGSYLIFESNDEIASMNGTHKPCYMLKYVLAMCGGVYLIYHAWVGRVDSLHLLLATVIALFTWPNLFERIMAFPKLRCDAKTKKCVSLKVIRECPHNRCNCDGVNHEAP